MSGGVTLRRLAVLLVALVVAGCIGKPVESPSIAVGSGQDAESALLAHIYAGALRSYGAAAHVQSAPDPLTGLDTEELRVVPGFTGRLLQRFQPGATALSDEQVYRAMIAALPEGVAVGDYTTAAQDKPALAVTELTTQAWGGRDLVTLTRHCGALAVGKVAGATVQQNVGRCRLPAAREYRDDAALFDGLRSGQVNAVWTSTADPDVPTDVLVLADRKPVLVRAENVVPLYRRNELDERQVLAINEVAGELDTAALAQMRRRVADGADPGSVADGWLAEHPLGR
ncbi:MAG: periplasmic glycine betaine/choline-binding protein of an ABC-type transport system [Mycobacterium sp.]|nr:periplasmic glycine betaine/choline-binding protein of an ABC-type transport system [Mycobacterium sp.]